MEKTAVQTQQTATQFYQYAASVILSAVMFGALHFGYGTIVNVVGPFVIGIIFGLYYQQYRNLKVLMVCHFLIDFVALSFQRV